MVQQEFQVQQLFIHHVVKKMTGGQDDEVRQVSFPQFTPP